MLLTLKLLLFFSSFSLPVNGYLEPEPMPGALHFYHCPCNGCILKERTSNMNWDVRQFPKDTPSHPVKPVDILWHEFMKDAIQVISAAPYSRLHDCGFKNCMGPPRSKSFINHYLDKIEQIRISIEKETGKSIVDSETWFKKPTQKQIIETEADIANIKLRYKQANIMLDNLKYKALDLFRRVLWDCPQPEENMAYFYNLGHLEFIEGDFEESLKSVSKFIDLAFKNNLPQFLDASTLSIQGNCCLESGFFDQAIEYFSLAIQKDPTNRDFYFDRAVAYFEIGDFDGALDGYLSSASESKNIVDEVPVSFSESFLEAFRQSSKEAMADFGPNLLKTAYGIETALWSFANDPINSTAVLARASYDFSESVVDYLKNLNQEKLENYGLEIRGFYEQFVASSDSEKASILGRFLGTYGTDALIGTAAVKGVNALRKIKQANRLCNLEALTISKADKEIVVDAAIKHAAQRKDYFKNVKLHVDRQNKHVQGKHNYIEGRSILSHPDPESLLQAHAGKGKAIAGRTADQIDYRELVDFKEIIGFHVDKETGMQTATSFGEIRYSKNGAHIIPAYPKD